MVDVHFDQNEEGNNKSTEKKKKNGITRSFLHILYSTYCMSVSPLLNKRLESPFRQKT